MCRYDRARCELKYVKDTQLLAAMAPPGGGRNPFSQRINACFSTINMTQPNDAQLKRIFSTLLNLKLAEFDDDVRPLAKPIVAASVEIYRAVSRELLPTPSKSHYIFNTRDLAKIVLGVMQVRARVLPSAHTALATRPCAVHTTQCGAACVRPLTQSLLSKRQAAVLTCLRTPVCCVMSPPTGTQVIL